MMQYACTFHIMSENYRNTNRTFFHFIGNID
jgi:hypothetical protein